MPSGSEIEPTGPNPHNARTTASLPARFRPDSPCVEVYRAMGAARSRSPPPPAIGRQFTLQPLGLREAKCYVAAR